MDDTYINSIEDRIVNALSANASQDELAELRQWLSESEDNRRLYNEYAIIWETSRAVGRHDDYLPDHAWNSLNKRIKPQKHSAQRNIPIRKVMMVAAMIAVVFLAGMLLVNYFMGNATDHQNRLTYTEYSSPYGSKLQVRLPDGSLVWLNAGSILRYSSEFNMSSREVYLEGEGYFDVTHNDQTPFWVQTTSITIKVLGTAFNVKAYPEESVVETTVERGSVQLIDPLSSSQEMTILQEKQKAVVLKAILSERKPEEAPLQNMKPNEIKPSAYIPIAEVKVNNNIATEVYTSWKDARWVIEREKLSSLAVMMERRYNVHIVFGDEELKDYVFTGKFENETLDQVLEVISLSAPIVYKIKQNTVYLNHNKMYAP